MKRFRLNVRLPVPSAAHGVAVAVATMLLGAAASVASPGAALAAECPNEAFRTGPSAALPDCRAYEQVSPADKNGFQAVSPDFPMQAAPSGEAIAYLSFLAAFSEAQSNSYPNAYVSRRTAGGWETTNVSPPTPDPTPPGANEVSYAFSEDLSQMVTWLPLERIAEGATPGVFNLFSSGTTSARSYSWINDVRPPHVPPEGCPSFLLAECFQFTQNLYSFAGASADFHHILFESAAGLLGAPEYLPSLFDSADEAGAWHVSLAGILPDGAIPAGYPASVAGSGSSLYYKSHYAGADDRVANAISQDGSRVIFQAASDEGTVPAEAGQAGMTEVYDRIKGSETVELSAPAAGATPSLTTAKPATFWAASADGSRVFFTSSAELTTPSYTGAAEPKGQDLYEYDLETKTLKDLTVDTNLPADAEEGAAVQGVLGASSGGSYVYFIARGQLVPGEGVDHGENLYVVHEGGAPVYIATLSESDGGDWTQTASLLESYVTPDGRHLAFTSVESLPTSNFPGGYGNEGQRETYEYSAPSGAEAARLICASCDPSGAPPVGPGLPGGVTQLRSAAGPSDSTPFHLVRVVSDSGGRVFFSSRDPLTPAAAANTQVKVFEYEQAGEGSCHTAGGCVFLLSSPESAQAAFFLDADSEGNNVFLATVSRLTASDPDHQLDVYDVRTGGGFAEPLLEAPCQVSCRESSLASPPGASPLTAFSAASGNLAPHGHLRKGRKANRRTTARRRLHKALKACQHKKGKKRQRRCELRARRRYRKATSARRSRHRRNHTTRSSHGKRRGR